MKKKTPEKHQSVRQLAWSILLQFEKNKPRLDALVSDIFGQYELDSRDRRFLKNLTSGTIRHLLYLDWIAAYLYKGRYKKVFKKVKTILRLALYEIIFMKNIPSHATLNEYVALAKKQIGLGQSKVINGILRNYLRKRNDIIPEKIISDKSELLSVKYSFPLWLIERWIGFWGEQETEKLCQSLNQLPEFDLRIYEKKISKEDFKALLKKSKVTFKESLWFENIVTVLDVQTIINRGWFEKGYCTLQDESANIPVEMLNVEKGDIVLDICAAPGGKYTQILEKQDNSVTAIAMDIDLDRLRKVKENVTRLGLVKGYYVQADSRNLPFKAVFNKILLDSPCSGLGVIQKHPDIKWRRSINEIQEFSELQNSMLAQAADILKKEGILVHSTCTIDYLENENVADSFLAKQKKHFEIIPLPAKFHDLDNKKYIRTFPHSHQMDGSFCAIFRKK